MIFLDADFLMSFFIDTEDNHEKATQIYEKIENEELIISNSIILEIMTVSNIKIKVSKEKLKEIYISLNSGLFNIIEDIKIYDETMERQINYHPQRLPFFDCLYLELMEQLGITKIATFDKHFNNKGIEVIDH
ncbi:PIN domain protein [Methanobrevibacter cuticularis]|uniref:PIN domain protein n=1 Tax=Methanobrevibacter cuticularis TaxID=47311 RepID=A0A166EIQ7_9EURY|nr:PIN domain-containing protein [Methanobrevibacter cuticularis]KZX16699.1 PIN domain protein [Methanobrevibacter cuticularis]